MEVGRGRPGFEASTRRSQGCNGEAESWALEGGRPVHEL